MKISSLCLPRGVVGFGQVKVLSNEILYYTQGFSVSLFKCVEVIPPMFFSQFYLELSFYCLFELLSLQQLIPVHSVTDVEDL